MSAPAPDALALHLAWPEVLDAPARAALEARLPEYVAARRWFRGKSRAIIRATLVNHVGLPGDVDEIGIVKIEYRDGGTEEYVLPLVSCRDGEAAWVAAHAPHLVVCACSYDDGTSSLICDGLGVARFQRVLLGLFAREAVVVDGGCSVRFRRVAKPLRADGAEPRSMDAEQSNTSIVFGDRYILKVTRRLERGVSADLEIGEFLTHAGYAHAPAVIAAAEIDRDGGPAATMAIVHAFAPNRGDAWSVMLGWIGRVLASSAQALPDEQRRLLRTLAQRVAELHLVLASRDDLVDFRLEVMAEEERRTLVAHASDSLGSVLEALAARSAALAADARDAAIEARASRGAIESRLMAFALLASPVLKTRIHGDLHLGQVLFTGDDFLLIDFEGEPARTLAERKAKRNPLADVAGILRSLHYVAAASARSLARPASSADVQRRAAAWHSEASAAFLAAYFEAAGAAPFVPATGGARATVLDYYVLEKCIYEIQYELDNRPDWVVLPVLGLLEAVEEHR